MAVRSWRRWSALHRYSGWVGTDNRFGERYAEEDMAVLAERIAASMLNDDSQSSSSGSDYNMSATTSEEGSPKAWNGSGRVSCTSCPGYVVMCISWTTFYRSLKIMCWLCLESR